MSLLRTLDRTSAVSNTAHARPFLTFLYPRHEDTPSKRRFSKKAIDNARRLPEPTTARMGTFFVNALVRAASCPKHAQLLHTLRGVETAPPKHQTTRGQSTWSKSEEDGSDPRPERKGPLKKVQRFAEKELQALIDYYGMEIDTRPEAEVPDDGNLVWNVGDRHGRPAGAPASRRRSAIGRARLSSPFRRAPPRSRAPGAADGWPRAACRASASPAPLRLRDPCRRRESSPSAARSLRDPASCRSPADGRCRTAHEAARSAARPVREDPNDATSSTPASQLRQQFPQRSGRLYPP